MISHHITIAKASFAAACLRPDVNKLNRDELSTFHALFEAAVTKCSPSNVQKCKQWLLINIVPSLYRTGTFGKYLASFSKYAGDGSSKHAQDAQAFVSQGRQRLHILYILNDLLHHVVYHSSNSAHRNSAIEGLQPYVLELFQYAISEQKSRVGRRIDELTKIWDREQYFSKIDLGQVRRSIFDKNRTAAPSVSNSDQVIPAKDLPYIMPATHGDPSTPYHDLPAANLMPHIAPNTAVPIRPENVRALHLAAGPADEGLINAVKDFLVDVGRIENPFSSLENEGIVAEMDELGQLSYYNENEEVIGDTYYGWSRAFCQKMKHRGRDKHEQGHRRSRSYSSSRSRSRTSPKRRRYGSSSERSRSHSRSRRARSPSYSPDPATPHIIQDRRYREEQRNSSLQAAHTMLPAAHTLQRPTLLPSLGPSGMPMPPPRPANWKGLWPPPPPPPPLSGVGGFSNVAFSPPPPPFS